MTNDEIYEFIDQMEELGDVWDADAVERVYGNMSLEEALNARRGNLSIFGNIIATILNRDADNE